MILHKIKCTLSEQHDWLFQPCRKLKTSAQVTLKPALNLPNRLCVIPPLHTEQVVDPRTGLGQVRLKQAPIDT